MTYQLHPLCTLFPRLAGAEFDALRDDIKANGLRQPIVLHDGMILDGGNRYAACVAAGVEPSFEPFGGGNLVSFVLSVNLHRRHMSAGQQAAIVASATDWAKAQTHGGKRRGDQAEGLPLETVAQRAAISGATERTQRDADKLVRNDPAKAREVTQGKTSLYRAVQETKPAAASPRAAVQAERDQLADEAHGDTDPVEMLLQLQAENEALAKRCDALAAEDGKAQLDKYIRLYERAQREQSAAMDRATKTAERERWSHRQLMRCGKAVGQDDPDKIAAAVEAMARKVKAPA